MDQMIIGWFSLTSGRYLTATCEGVIYIQPLLATYVETGEITEVLSYQHQAYHHDDLYRIQDNYEGAVTCQLTSGG